MNIFFMNLLDHGLDIIGLATLIYLAYRATKWWHARGKTPEQSGQ